VNSQPPISIITVCFNEQAYIEATLQSVLTQTLPGIELIVIDGGSADGTVEKIRAFENRIHYFISERDNGIYDGMNKGLASATGEYVFFLNGGDVLNGTDILEKLFAATPGADAYYGETLFITENGTPLGTRSELTNQQTPENLSWKSLQMGMVVSHQAFVVKRSLCSPFLLQYRICADVDWMITVLKKCSHTVNTRLVISQFRTGGTSARHRKKAWRERYAVLKKHYGFLPNLFNHLRIIWRYAFSGKRY
jgi:glycosyltransferase involved in cell wall biosynthesis